MTVLTAVAGGALILGTPTAAHAKQSGEKVFHGSKCVRLFEDIAMGTTDKYSSFTSGPGPDECTVTLA